MATPTTPTQDDFNRWADDPRGPVALCLRQRLLPVEGRDAVIFPPTYAGIDYNIDKLPDGTQVVLVDSAGSQANRIEPIFSQSRFSKLVPQIDIRYGQHEDGTPKSLSLLAAGHRLGDAIVRSSGPDPDATGGPENEPFDLAKESKKAFEAYLDRGDATQLAELGPTSLVFGVWDSRDTEAKLPRLVQSTIRAWNVTKLRRSAQYTPALDYKKLDAFKEEEIDKAATESEKSGGKSSNPLAQRGFVHVPAAEQPGGVVVHGEIIREVTLNLVALRRLAVDGRADLARYILGLSLVAATEPPEPFLRQGCLLTPDPDCNATWELVARNGSRTPLLLEQEAVSAYAEQAAETFRVGPDRTAIFDRKRAQADRDAAKKK